MAYGMVPITHGGYSYQTGGAEEFAIHAAGTSIWAGDVVGLNVSGGIERYAVTNGPDAMTGTAAPTKATALGVFMGCRYTDVNGVDTWAQYWPGTSASTTNPFGFVVTDPNAVFKIQQKDAFTTTMIGTTVAITYADGNDTTGNSGNNIAAGAASTDFLALRRIGVVKNGSNEDSSTPDVIVRWSAPSCLLYGFGIEVDS